MRSLYPEIEPNLKYTLDTNTIHKVYFEESGNPAGIPVLFIHGGPGSGSNENHRRYFNPEYYRIINFDQRGCNRSSPAGEVKNNTTQDLLQDIESIRHTLNIDKWILFGGSWGATLSLLYAQNYPQAVLAMVLRGSFLARPRDIEWFLGKGANRIFPDAWERFETYIPEDERHNLITAYYQRLTGNHSEEVEKAARHWADWTGRVVTYLLDLEEFILPDDMTSLINEIRIEAHYGAHSYFINPDQILDDMGKIPPVPVKIIHGRRDLTCTLDASWDLHQRLEDSELIIVEQGGHLAGETVMIDALVTATDDLARLFD